MSLLLIAASDDPFDAPSERDFRKLSGAASIPEGQCRFLRAWVRNKGDLLLILEEEGLAPSDVARYLAYPSTLRILTAASEARKEIPPPIPSKEELAAAWGLVSRSPDYPITYQKEARQELSKLMGYYLTPSDGAVNVGVQVVLKGDDLANG